MKKYISFTVAALLTFCFAVRSEAAVKKPARKPSGTVQKPTVQKPTGQPTLQKPSGERPDSKSVLQKPSGDRSGSVSKKGERSGDALEKFKGKIPQPSAEQQQNMKDLQTDTKALGESAKGSKDEVQKLASDLNSMVDNPPDQALVQNLASDLSAALSDSNLNDQEMSDLTKDLYAVMNSAGLTIPEMKSLENDVTALLEAASASQPELQAVKKDMQAIYDDLQKPNR